MQHPFLKQNCYRFGIGTGLKRIISKTNYYTFQDCTIFWNYPGSKVMRLSIGCVSLAGLA